MSEESEKERAEIWRECLARRVGGCAFNPAACLRCGPVEQGLRAATWLECHWSHRPVRERR